jgi:hypothetical protein
MSCVQCVDATSSSSVTDSVTLFCVLLLILIDDQRRKVDVPLTLLRELVSFAKSESDWPVITNLCAGLPSHLHVGFNNKPCSEVPMQYFIVLCIAFTCANEAPDM